MAKPLAQERLFLPGPAGNLEAILESPAGRDASGAAVVLHPHPQHGGTLHNKVAYTLARAFLDLGFATLRFNFRGTEASEGVFDGGDGETDDALAAAAWLRARYPGLPFWLAGFSFGAAMAIRAAIVDEPDGLVCVAPAVSRFPASLARQPACPWLIVQGDVDELVAVEAIIDWVNTLKPGPELAVLAGAEHFFHGRLVELRKLVSDFASRHTLRAVTGP